MSEMVDRIAAVMTNYRTPALDFESFSEEYKNSKRELAKLILSCMRKPTEAMLDVAFGDRENVWQAMIDEALK